MSEQNLDNPGRVRAYLGPKIESMGYISPPTRFLFPDMFSWIRRISSEIGAYVIVTDGRGKGNPLRVDFWVAPIMHPDDGLKTTELGTRIVVLEWYHITSEMLDQAVKKLNYYEKLIPGLAEVAEWDLMEAPVLKKAQLSFKWFHKTLKDFRELCTDDEWSEFRDAVRTMAKNVKSDGTVSNQILRMLKDKLGDVIEEGFEPDSKLAPDDIAAWIGFLQLSHMMFDGEFSRVGRKLKSTL